MLILGKCPGAPELQTLLAAMHVLNAAEQMQSGLAHIELGRRVTEAKERAKIMAEKYDWDKNQALKIWYCGPDIEGAHVVQQALPSRQPADRSAYIGGGQPLH